MRKRCATQESLVGWMDKVLIAAVRELKEDQSKYYIVAVIVALNWSISELQNINNQIDKVYHFNVNPNKFIGFDDASQIDLNRYIQGILNND